MPLFLEHTTSSFRWGIWRVEESPEELLSMLPRQEVYKESVRRFTAVHRRLEWLAVRVLLYTLLGEEKEIAYYPDGKPYLADTSVSFSISHTKGYVAVVLGEPGREVGIDIEQYGERVRKVAHKFMREDEVASPFRGTDTWSLLLHWSAKEAVFKCLNALEVDFRRHMRMLPFAVCEEGSFFAEEYRTVERRRFTIHYRLFPDFVLTLAQEQGIVERK